MSPAGDPTAPQWQRLRKEDAEMLLVGNTMNRPPNKRRVEQYRREMNAKKWIRAGNPINIFDDGEKLVLLNGQNRLMAFIASDLDEIEFLICWEESTDVFSAFDVNGVRTTSNLLTIAGFGNTTVLEAIARADMNMTRSKGSKDTWDRNGFTKNEILEWVQAADPLQLQFATDAYSQARGTFKATNTWYASLAYLVRTRSECSDKWLGFHEPYRHGANIPPGSPILALRSYTMNRIKFNDRMAQTPWDRQAHLAIGIKSWNDWVRGKSDIKYYKFSKASLPMPEVR